MIQQPTVPSEELIARGDEMRLQATNGIAVPLTRTQGPRIRHHHKLSPLLRLPMFHQQRPIRPLVQHP